MPAVERRRQMDTLVDVIVEEMGLTRAQAEQVARITINFLQQRMPRQATGYVDAALSAAEAETALEQGRNKVEGIKRT
jgi:hypothetical protein